MQPILYPIRVPEQPETGYRTERRRFADLQASSAQVRAARRGIAFGLARGLGSALRAALRAVTVTASRPGIAGPAPHPHQSRGRLSGRSASSSRSSSPMENRTE